MLKLMKHQEEVLEEYLATIFLIKDYFETIYTKDLSKIEWAEYEGCKFCTKDEETGHIIRGYYPEPLPYWVYEYDSDISEQDVIDWFEGKKVSDDIKSDCEIYIGNGILCFEDMYFIGYLWLNLKKILKKINFHYL